MQRVLAAHWPDGLHVGYRLVALGENNNAIKLDFANGKSAEVDILIGADGQHSLVRKFVAGEEGVAYSRTSGFRGIVPVGNTVGNLPSLPDPQAVQFWMGPNAHLLHFALESSGADVNFLAVVEGPSSWPHENWVAPITHDVALAAFEGWHPAVVEMIPAVPHTLRWGLFEVRPLWTWRRGPAVLIGDAAHGMLPRRPRFVFSASAGKISAAFMRSTR